MSILSIFAPTHRLPLSKAGRRHGWKPDHPDIRDHAFVRLAPALPTTFDLRTSPNMPAVYDQGNLGSCTANGWAACFEFDQKKQGLVDFMPSRLYLYLCERIIDGTVKQDAGAQIRDGAKVLASQGVTSEKLWPYVVSNFKQMPPSKVIADALRHKAVIYQRVDNSNADTIKHALVLGFPVVFGCTLYEEFESNQVAADGKVSMPTGSSKPIGGHCMTIVGWTADSWIVRNSWGPGWGDKGYCYMPLAYLTNLNLAADFWVLESVTKA